MNGMVLIFNHKLGLSVAVAFLVMLIGGSLFNQSSYAVQLKILESQLNKHSITGILQNPYNYPVGGINVQAEFYDKDGRLVGVRDIGFTTKSEIKPDEKSSYKIPDNGKAFPHTEFNVTAEGTDYTNMVEVSSSDLIGQIRNLGKALKDLPDEVVITVTHNATDNSNSTNKTLIYHNSDGTNRTVNVTDP